MLSRAWLNCTCAPMRAFVSVWASKVSSCTCTSSNGLASIWRILICVSWMIVWMLTLLPKLLQVLPRFSLRARERRGVQLSPRAGSLMASFLSSAGAIIC
jgi:hypothetical protein